MIPTTEPKGGELTPQEELPLVLLVVDDQGSLERMAEVARGRRFRVVAASSLEEARARRGERNPDLVILDQKLPDGPGTDLLEELGEDPWVEVLLVADEPTVGAAVQALRHRAVDYLSKPVDLDRLASLLDRLHRHAALRTQVRELRTELRDLGRFGSMVGSSPEMQRVYDLVEKVAPTDTSVLIVGESGTGKELVAQTIHRLGAPRGAPFLPLNCGAISPNLIESELFGHEKGSFTGATRRHRGVFERASGGTLFLDEITEMPTELQVKLLRVLETGRLRRVGGQDEVDVDVRVLAATNRDPDEALEEGHLREDLLYRLRVFPIELPPLRQRKGDAERLAQHFLDELNREHDTRKRFEPAALECLLEWPWPGNVRELKNVVKRAWILADGDVGLDALPRELSGDEPPRGPSIHIRVGTSLEDAEKEIVLATLDQMGGRRDRTAETLGISKKTLYNRLKKYESESS